MFSFFVPKRRLNSNTKRISFKMSHWKTFITVFKELNVRCIQVVVSLKQLFTWWGKDYISSHIFVIDFPSFEPHKKCLCKGIRFTGEFGFSCLLLLLLFFSSQLGHLQLKLGFPCQEVFNGYHCALECHLLNTYTTLHYYTVLMREWWKFNWGLKGKPWFQKPGLVNFCR